jgi:hypothetical protein
LELPEKHARVLLTPGYRYRCLHGGRNGAKDWSGAGVVIERAVRVPTRVLCTREIQKTIKDSIYQLLSDTIKRLGYSQYFTVNDNEITSNCGSSFIFTGLRDLNVDNLKSIEGVDVCIVGEAQNLTRKSWEILDPTIRKAGSEIWIFYNDQSTADFVYQLTVKNPPADMICEHVNYTDLPDEWLTDVVKSQAERMKLENPARYRHIWLGEPGSGGEFLPEFGAHLREMPFHIQPHESNLYGSLDYGDGQGENASATSFGLWHIDQNGKPHRLCTYYKRHQDAATYAREIVAMIRSFPWTQGVMPKMTFADPSMFIKRSFGAEWTNSVADIFEEYGLGLTPAVNDRVNGWRVMRNYFTLDETGVPRSRYWEGLNDEYEEYIPTLQTRENNPDDCIKCETDHCADSARYGFVAFMGLRYNPDSISGDSKRKEAAKLNLLVSVAQRNISYSETGY